MLLPTSVPETPESAYSRVVSTARGVKSTLGYMSNLIASGSAVPVDNLIGLYQSLNAAQGIGLSIQSVSGLPAYAQNAMGDPNYDIVAAFRASIIECKAVTDWLLVNMPGDGQGGFTGWHKQEDGTIERVTVDSEALAPLASLIAAAIGTFA